MKCSWTFDEYSWNTTVDVRELIKTKYVNWNFMNFMPLSSWTKVSEMEMRRT